MKNNKYYYPAIFHTAEEGGFWITFPDFESIYSQGETISDACEMARDALGLELTDYENNHKIFPNPSNINDIKSKKNAQVLILEFDFLEYKKKHNSKAVKKTLSIPSWLNEEALSAGINFSAALQRGLKEELGY